MNVEFIKLSDGATAITDENGRISKRETETSSEELLIENKIETIEESIDVTKKKVKDYKGFVFLSKHMLISQPILVLVFALYNLIEILICSILVVVPATAIWGITYHISKRELKGFEGKLKKAEELKLEFEKELAKEKEIVIQRKPTPINKPISLVQQNESEIPLIAEKLEIAYSDAIHSKPKKLVLKRNPNNSKK